ncbi:hypothetical protein ABSL23_02280 [Halobacterium sp. NMX12-1]|uniref:Uncharacterized protein n=1 Tax=Halobacterium sp. NMX12-1 TaxID=3166650 RepID=A0AAU8CCW7_9EURY
MSKDTDDATTWKEQRVQATISGEKKPIDESTKRQAERRREGL